MLNAFIRIVTATQKGIAPSAVQGLVDNRILDMFRVLN